MEEPERALGGDHLVFCKGVGRSGGGVRVELGQRGGDLKLDAVAEHGESAREPLGGPAGLLDAHLHAAGEPRRRTILERRGHLGRWPGLPRGQLAQHLRHRERVAAGRSVAGGDELGSGIHVEASLGELADGLGAERPELEERCGRGEPGEWPARVLVEERPPRHDQRDRHLVDPVRHVVEAAERVEIGPLRVVDEEHERSFLGELGQEPVDAVQRRERPLALLGRRQPERRRRERRRPTQQPPTARRRPAQDRPLEELADDPEAEVGLELRAPGPEHAEPACLGHAPGRADQGRLAGPDAALDQRQAAVTLLGRVQRERDPLQLIAAFEQRLRDGAFRHHPH